MRCDQRDSNGVQCELDANHLEPCACPEALARFRKGSAYQAHVDICEQCGKQPFNLCDTGYGLLFGDLPRRAPAEERGTHRNCDANLRDERASHRRTAEMLQARIAAMAKFSARAQEAEAEVLQLRAEVVHLKNVYETRSDGVLVRKDRWESGMRNVAAVFAGMRAEFEIGDIVERVRSLQRENARLKGGICLAGWHCPDCKGFVGEEKEEQPKCIHCESVKPTIFTVPELDEL